MRITRFNLAGRTRENNGCWIAQTRLSPPWLLMGFWCLLLAGCSSHNDEFPGVPDEELAPKASSLGFSTGSGTIPLPTLWEQLTQAPSLGWLTA